MKVDSALCLIVDQTHPVLASDKLVLQKPVLFFKVLEHDRKPKWWVFRSWGRVGTTIGGTKLDSFDERLDATRFDVIIFLPTSKRL